MHAGSRRRKRNLNEELSFRLSSHFNFAIASGINLAKNQKKSEETHSLLQSGQRSRVVSFQVAHRTRRRTQARHETGNKVSSPCKQKCFDERMMFFSHVLVSFSSPPSGLKNWPQALLQTLKYTRKGMKTKDRTCGR